MAVLLLGATTTGGLHAIVEFALALIAGRSYPVARMFPLLCLALLIREIVSWSRRAGLSKPAACLAASVVVGVPGTLTLAGSA